jgi:hypothetical protein
MKKTLEPATLYIASQRKAVTPELNFERGLLGWFAACHYVQHQWIPLLALQSAAPAHS